MGDEFEATLGRIINAVSSNSIVLERGAGSLAKTAENTQDRTSVVAASSEEALTNVQSVAASAAELTSSLRSIAEQVEHSRKMAGEAVLRAEKIDVHIADLTRAASRIGGVVQSSGEGDECRRGERSERAEVVRWIRYVDRMPPAD